MDIDREQAVGRIEGMNGVHGVAIAPKLGRGFVTSGLDKSIRVFDLKTLKTIADIPVEAEGPRMGSCMNRPRTGFMRSSTRARA